MNSLNSLNTVILPKASPPSKLFNSIICVQFIGTLSNRHWLSECHI